MQRWVTLGEAQETARGECSVESAAEALLEPFRRALLLIAERQEEAEGNTVEINDAAECRMQ
jgi:hypothetical protein